MTSQREADIEEVRELLRPSASLLCKLASIAIHAEELLAPDGHDLDRVALLSGLTDPEVATWLGGMSASAMAPRKRSAR